MTDHPPSGIRPPGGRLAWLVWGAGLGGYLVAVFHRFSLGVAGFEAAERFDIGAAALGILPVAQVVVYCAAQVPAGLLVDRYGFRRTLVAATLLVAVGQAAFALATNVPLALAARILVGLGDALVFVSVFRLVPAWFPPRRNPVMLQVSGLVGQLGAIAAAFPLVFLLERLGWTATFLAAAGVGLVVALPGAVLARERVVVERPRTSIREIGREVRSTWQEPGTRLGVWTHFVTQFPAMTFVLLWGYPYLVTAEGLAPRTAGLLLTVLTLSFIASGPVIGYLVGRLPLRRTRMALAFVGLTAGAWTAVLAWPGPAPLWLLVVLLVVMGFNMPASMIGFDFARSFNPERRIGVATGMVNSGGYVASLATILAIGLILTWLSPAGSYTPEAFRWAFLAQYPVWVLGVVQLLRFRRRARTAYNWRPHL